MDEQDAQIIEELKQKGQEPSEGQEPSKTSESKEVEEKQEASSETEKPKQFGEDYVKGLRRENAKYRRQLRDTQKKMPEMVQSEVDKIIGNQFNTNYPQGGQNQPYQQPYQQNQQNQQGQQGQYYDPRVDDMLLQNKLNSIKEDQYFKELFNEEDEEGRTFEEKVLEEAEEKSWPIDELDALVLKMEKEKILKNVEQGAIDKAYKSMTDKEKSSAEKNVSSGKNIEERKSTSIDGAVKKAMKEHGVTDLSSLK